jgi:ABC-2 type transport system ATP-binding protein
VITVESLTKRYGKTLAVDDLSFEVRPGVVTGFLGPNGSGKSTTMRVIMGLDRPTSGRVAIEGHPYRDLPFPLHEVGALLDAKAFHPRRSALNHLRALAASNKIPFSRVDHVLEVVGLSHVARKRAGTYSLGMSQRLGIATAILGDPKIVLFDEPINGLDPEGIRWVRDFFKSLAADGRTVLVSSHLMSEMALTADEVVVIGRGRLIRQAPITELTSSTTDAVAVTSPEAPRLAAALRAKKGLDVQELSPTSLLVNGTTAAAVGQAAHDEGVVLHELATQHASLEDIFMELTADSVEFSGANPIVAVPS